MTYINQKFNCFKLRGKISCLSYVYKRKTWILFIKKKDFSTTHRIHSVNGANREKSFLSFFNALIFFFFFPFCSICACNDDEFLSLSKLYIFSVSVQIKRFHAVHCSFVNFFISSFTSFLIVVVDVFFMSGGWIELDDFFVSFLWASGVYGFLDLFEKNK